MTKRVYNVHLLIETDQESDTLAEQVREWASDEEAFSGSVLLDISQIREAHLDLDTLSATMERFVTSQKKIITVLCKAATIAEQHTAILEKVACALASLAKDEETSTKPDDGVWRWRRSKETQQEASAEDETAADEAAKDETHNEI